MQFFHRADAPKVCRKEVRKQDPSRRENGNGEKVSILFSNHQVKVRRRFFPFRVVLA
jgi:hypothetical protein